MLRLGSKQNKKKFIRPNAAQLHLETYMPRLSYINTHLPWENATREKKKSPWQEKRVMQQEKGP